MNYCIECRRSGPYGFALCDSCWAKVMEDLKRGIESWHDLHLHRPRMREVDEVEGEWLIRGGTRAGFIRRLNRLANLVGGDRTRLAIRLMHEQEPSRS